MRRPALWLLVLLGGAAIACNGLAYAASGHTALVLASLGWTLAGAGAVAGLAAGLGRVAPDFRTSWTLLLVASCFWLVGQIAWDGYLVAGAAPPVPSIGDAGWVLFAVFATLGVYRFARPTGTARWIVRLDTLGVVIASTAIIVSVFHDDLLHSHASTALKSVALAYPLLYCAFATVLAESLARYPSLLRTPSIALILAGAVLQAVGFVLWSPLLFQDTYVAGRAAPDLLWTLGALSVGAGGFAAARRNLPLRPAEQVLRRRSAMPAIMFTAL